MSIAAKFVGPPPCPPDHDGACSPCIPGWPGWFDDRGKCDGCGKVKDRVIRRNLGSNGQPPRMRCDECHEEKR